MKGIKTDKFRKLVVIKMKPERMKEVLFRSGYYQHNDGYVKDVTKKRRYHAYIREKTIELHFDRKFNYYHTMMAYYGDLGREAKLIRRMEEKIYPAVTISKKFIVKEVEPEIAPNVMELQRLASTLNQKKKWWERLKLWLYPKKTAWLCDQSYPQKLDC